MCVVRGQNFIARAAVDGERHLVAHDAAWQEQGRLLAEKIGGALAQTVDAWIFAPLLASDHPDPTANPLAEEVECEQGDHSLEDSLDDLDRRLDQKLLADPGANGGGGD